MRLPTFRYRLYGLALASEIFFPELTEDTHPNNAPDVRIGTQDACPTVDPDQWFLETTAIGPDGHPWLRYARTADGYLLRYSGFADFVVTYDRREIRFVGTLNDASELTARHLVLDSVLPLFLNLFGSEALHATAIATDRGACAFTGPAGTGKSTLAASFVKVGYKLLCDDCLALEDRGTIVAMPGYRGLRLWLDALEAMGGESGMLMRVAGYTTKSRYLGSGDVDHFHDQPNPLLRIYSLHRAQEG